MSLAENVDALAERVAEEFNDVRSEVSTSLSGKSDSGHTHSYLPLSGGAVTGNITRSGLGNTTYFSVDTSRVDQMPFEGILWHDLLRFNTNWGTPVVEYQETDEGSWIDWGADGLVDTQPFSGIQDQSLEMVHRYKVADSWVGTRWTWNHSSIAYSSASWLVIAQAYTDPAPYKRILLESSSNGSSWTTRHDSTYNIVAAPVWHKMDSYGGDTYLRLTITHLTNTPSSGAVNISGIQLLTHRWGDQGQGVEYEYPYTWDDLKRIGIGGAPSGTSGNALKVTGNIEITGTPSGSTHAATKGYVDTGLSGKSSTSHNHDGTYSASAHSHTHPNVPQSWQSLSSSSTLTMDCDLGTRFRCSALTENTTIADPTDKADGQQLLLAVVASGGTRTVSLNGSIVNMTGDTFPVSVASGKRWIGGFLIEGSTALLIASKVQP